MRRDTIHRRYFLKYTEAFNEETVEQIGDWVKDEIVHKLKEFKKEEYGLEIEVLNLNIFKIYRRKRVNSALSNICIFSIDIKCNNWVMSDEEKDFYEEEEYNSYIGTECGCYDIFDEEYIEYENLEAK